MSDTPRPTLASILKHRLIADFLEDASPAMTRHQLTELARSHFEYIDEDYIDNGVTLSVRDRQHAISAMVDLACERFAYEEEIRPELIDAGILYEDGTPAHLAHFYGGHF